MCDSRCGHGPGDWANGCGPPAAAYRQGWRQEALCFALWCPSTGLKRKAAIVREIILPKRCEHILTGNVDFPPRGCRQGDLGSSTAKRRPRVQAQPSCIRMARPAARTNGRSGMYWRRRQGPPGGIWLAWPVGSDGYGSARFWDGVRGEPQLQWCEKVRLAGPNSYRIQCNNRIVPPTPGRGALMSLVLVPV